MFANFVTESFIVVLLFGKPREGNTPKKVRRNIPGGKEKLLQFFFSKNWREKILCRHRSREKHNITRDATYVSINNVALSRNHFCHGKAKMRSGCTLAYYIAVKNIITTDGVAMEMRRCILFNVALHVIANNKNTRSFSCKLPETNLASADRVC